MKKIILLLFVVVILYLVGLSYVSAATARELEIEYLRISGQRPETVDTRVEYYVKYIYNLSLIIGGLVALGALIYAGFRYLSSAGSPEKLQDAKDQIRAALLGTLLLFLSFLIIRTINPSLVIFSLKPTVPFPSGFPSGVLLCSTNPHGDLITLWGLREQYDQKQEELAQATTTQQADQIIQELRNTIVPQIESVIQLLKTKNCAVVSGSESKPEEWAALASPVICFMPTKERRDRFIEYGAVVYDDPNEDLGTTKSQYFVYQFLPGAVIGPTCFSISFPPALIKTFVYDPCNAQMAYYEEENLNRNFPDARQNIISITTADGYIWSGVTFYPKSMIVDPGLLVILSNAAVGPGAAGIPVRERVFWPGVYNDLLQYDSITIWEPCESSDIRARYDPHAGQWTCPVPDASMAFLICTK